MANGAGAGVGAGAARKKRKAESLGGAGEGEAEKRKGTVGAGGGPGAVDGSWAGTIVDASTFAAFDPRIAHSASSYSTQLPPPPQGYATALPQPPPSHQQQQHAATGSATRNALGEPFRPLPPPLASTAYDAAARPSDVVKREVVEGLEGRIAELERQLRAREAADVSASRVPPAAPPSFYAHAPHTRSPSFHYAFPAQSSAPQTATPYGYPPSSTTYPSSAASHPLSSSVTQGGIPPLPSPSAPTYPPQQQQQPAYPPIQLAPPGGPGGASSPRTGRSLSALSSAAAAAGIEDLAASSSAGWGAQESNLRSSVPPASGWAAAPPPAFGSPLSSLRYSALPAADGGEGFVLSPRGSVARESRERGTPVFAVVGAGQGATTPGGASGSARAAGSGGGGGGGASTRPGSSSSATSPAHSSAATSSASSSSPPKETINGGGGGASAADVATFSALDDFSLSPELYALLHPSYPSSLPPIATVHHLVQTFFLRAKIPAQMLNHRTILESMLYGPADPRWPDEALLHAMCAFAAQYVSEESLGSVGPHAGAGGLGLELGGDGGDEDKARRSRYWERDGVRSAKAYHYKHAKRSIHEAVDSDLNVGKARDMLQVLQGCIITCYVAYQSASFTDLWLFGGLATRLCTPLGLNHLEPWDFFHNRCGPSGEDWSRRIRFAPRAELLGLPQTLDEHAERATTFWMAFAVDRFASASTDWSTSIDESAFRARAFLTSRFAAFVSS